MAPEERGSPLEMVHVPEGGGDPVNFGMPSAIICQAQWTEGACFIIDQQVPPATITAAHSHRDETQGAYLVRGTLGFWVDGTEVTAEEGSYVLRPAGAVHALWNISDEPAHMLEITTPAAEFQKFLLEFSEMNDRGAGAEELTALANGYGTVFADDVTADLCARHGLSTRGAGFSR